MDSGGVPGHRDLLSKLSSSGSDTTPALPKLQMAFPTISIDDDDIVYMASSTKHGIMENMEFMIAIDGHQYSSNELKGKLLKPTEKEPVKLTDKKEGKHTRVHGDKQTGRTRLPVNKRVMKTLEQLRAINWSCPRRLGEQMKDADNGDQGAC
ncbi:hypothetical protein CFC21_037757 [Triticum aestivum]|uniref:Uncharacterized protein n=3 Tax=Triticum TaxID=4564 RepID=A0A9R0RWP3_TRITD|nr:hypothetical protein CFC21_037757 [Triticum aestivum]VAH68261.1 unnamed protein product [Triticum turgidum subsp. durum]